MIVKLILFSSILIIAIANYYELKKATKPKNGIVLATSFTNEMLQDERVVNCIERTQKNLKLIFLFSIFLGLLPLVLPLTDYTSIYFICIIFVVVLIFYIPIYRGFKFLRNLKAKEGWTVGAKARITIDTKLSLMGNSQAFPSWPYVFPLILIFLGVLLNKAEETKLITILIGLAIIFSQILLHLVYRNRRNIAPTHDPDLNIKINEIRKGKSTRLIYIMTLIMSICFVVFSLFQNKNPYNLTPLLIFVIASSVSLIGGIFQIQKFDMQAAELMPDLEEFVDEDHFYDIFGYKNPDDPRVFVEPRIGSKQEINRGNPKGKVLYFASSLLVLLLILGSFLLLTYSINVQYKLITNGDVIKIEAPPYGLEINKYDILEVNYLDKAPEGNTIRTNGFGGEDKAYGNFSIQGYGPVKLYHYNGVGQYIEIITKDLKILYSEPTIEETKLKYEELKIYMNK